MVMSLDELKGTTPETEAVENAKKGTVVETASGQKITTFRPEEIGAPKKEENTIQKNIEEQLSVLDEGIQKHKERLYEKYVVPQIEAEAEAALSDEDSDENEEKSNNNTTEEYSDDLDVDVLEEVMNTYTEEPAVNKFKVESPKVQETITPKMESIKEDLGKDFFEDEDIDDIPLAEGEEDNSEEELEQVKVEIRSNIKPINNVIDLTKFKISKKPASSSALLKTISSVTKSADWVLFAAKKAITMTSLNGTELDHFNPRTISKSSNKLNTYKQLYSIMYNHLQDANKPATLEAWTKTIPFYDINHLYFAIYRACYADNNIVPYTCPHCSKISMVKVDINEMVKFEEDKIKEAFWAIYNRDTTSADKYEAQLVQISDNFAAAIKLPTVYSVIFENAALDSKFLDKYSDLLGLISYIDSIYYINMETGELEEVKVKTDPNDFIKTTKRKVSTYAKILCSLNSDQYHLFVTKMQDLMDSNDGISYIQPSAKCTHCGEEIPESVVDPLDMVFTRHQLGAISSL